MEHLAQRCAAMAAAALTTGGLIAALTSMAQQPLADVQIRDFDLVGFPTAHVDTGPPVETTENHYGPQGFGPDGSETPHNSLSDLLFDRGEGDLGAGGSVNIGELENELNALLSGGGGLDPQNPLGLVPPDIDPGVVPGIGSSTTAGVFGGTETTAGAAAVTALSTMLMGLPVAYQAFTTAIASMEAELNAALVQAQQAAADQLFGDNPEVNDVVNWIFTVNNTVLAQNESAFNGLLGIGFDAHSSLLSHLDPGVAGADWSVLFGLSPDEFNEIINVLQADNISLLGSIDWAGLFNGLF